MSKAATIKMDALTLISKYMFCKARSLRAVTLDFCSNGDEFKVAVQTLFDPRPLL